MRSVALNRYCWANSLPEAPYQALLESHQRRRIRPIQDFIEIIGWLPIELTYPLAS